MESLQANYKISAAVLNLDPRKLATDALQPVWGLNQKLELLKIAFEVSYLKLLDGAGHPQKLLCSNAAAMQWLAFLPCPAMVCTATQLALCVERSAHSCMILLMSGLSQHGSCASSFAMIYACNGNTSSRLIAAARDAQQADRELSQIPVLVQSTGSCLPILADIWYLDADT